jgi:16S rRNA (uracil1498-N3)-methyltransferase
MHARFYAPNLDTGSSSVELPPEEAEHLARVLRLGAGAEVRVFDGRGREFTGRVERVDRSRTVVTIDREVPAAGGAESPLSVVLAQALLKGDSMDQVVRDAVMLGVSRIVPLQTERSQMPASRVLASGRVERWRRIAVASVKQCGRAVVPEVAAPETLDQCLRGFAGTARFFLAEPALAGAALPARVVLPPAGSREPILLVAGPEGGWTAGELAAAAAAGCRPLTLGPRILRAEAAATVGITALQCFYGDFASAAAGV